MYWPTGLGTSTSFLAWPSSPCPATYHTGITALWNATLSKDHFGLCDCHQLSPWLINRQWSEIHFLCSPACLQQTVNCFFWLCYEAFFFYSDLEKTTHTFMAKWFPLHHEHLPLICQLQLKSWSLKPTAVFSFFFVFIRIRIKLNL